jgi:CHAT domain-containing protein
MINISSVKLQREMAMLDHDEGNLPVAEDRLTELIDAIASEEAPIAKNELCQCLINRTTIYQFANRWEDALQDLERCETIAATLKGLSRGAILHGVYHSRTRIFSTPYTPVYDLEKARAALAEFRNYSSQDWITLELEGEIEFRARNWKQAAELYRLVAQALETNQWLRGAASCHLRAGLSLIELEEWRAARQEIDTALTFFEKFGPPEQFAATQMAKARLLSAAGLHDAAWELANQSIQGFESLIRLFRNLFEQQRFVLDKIRFYHQAFDIALQKGGQSGLERAWTIAERAKSFYLCQLIANADVQLFDGVDPADVLHLNALDEKIDQVESHHDRLKHSGTNPDLLTELSRQLQEILDEKRTLLGKLMRSNPRWAALKTPNPFDLGTEIKKLDPMWIPLSYFFQPRGDGAALYLFFAGQDRIPHCITTEWSADELDALREARDRLRGRLPAYARLFPEELAEKVLPPELMAVLQPGQKVLISPHDLLRAVPIHTIQAEDGSRLIDQHPVQYIPTLGLLSLQRQDKNTHSSGVLLMGCEQDNFQDPPLKEVPDEIQKLQELWALKRPGLVRSCLVAQAESPAGLGFPLETWHDAEFLHIACHGVFPEDRPLDAALRLGKDAIRASDFFAVKLRARLVSLSACALGRQTRREAGVDLRGDEWLGLYLPLFYAGAQTLLVSLWDANSQVAVPFMSALHGELSGGASPEVAFQAAQRQVGQKPAPFWANWYLVGFPQ